MIRIATIDDLPAMTEIYNQAIAAGFQTCFTKRVTPEERYPWFQDHDAARYPLLVFMQDGEVVGWLSISPYRQGRPALERTVEVSYFIDNRHWGKGIGSALLQAGLEKCREMNYPVVLAIILEPNIASAKLLEKYGFEKWGYLPGVAEFNGVVCSQVYFGKMLA